MLANKSMNQFWSTIHAKFGISRGAASVWPDKAFVAAIGQHHISEKLGRLSSNGRATGRAPVLCSAAVVRLAKALRDVRLAATVNRAYSGGSHRSLHIGFAGQNPLSVGALFGFAISTLPRLAAQGFRHA
jgi:hypothetical protein